MLDPIILIRGAGDIASGIALRLYNAGLRRILLLECASPLAVRRQASFSEAVFDGCMTVEGVTAALITHPDQCHGLWQEACIPIYVDPTTQSRMLIKPHVFIDATLRKAAHDISLHDAPLVIGLGPGFCVGHDVHRIVETQRGNTLGRVIRKGSALPNTGTPHAVQGYTTERVIRAPADGIFLTLLDIGSHVNEGDVLGEMRSSALNKDKATQIFAPIAGTLRGLLRSGMRISKGCKAGDIEPNSGIPCHTVSDKALAIGGGVLEAIMEYYYTKPRIKDGILQGI